MAFNFTCRCQASSKNRIRGDAEGSSKRDREREVAVIVYHTPESNPCENHCHMGQIEYTERIGRWGEWGAEKLIRCVISSHESGLPACPIIDSLSLDLQARKFIRTQLGIARLLHYHLSASYTTLLNYLHLINTFQLVKLFDIFRCLL